jgi:hypothetical protein
MSGRGGGATIALRGLPKPSRCMRLKWSCMISDRNTDATDGRFALSRRNIACIKPTNRSSYRSEISL